MQQGLIKKGNQLPSVNKTGTGQGHQRDSVGKSCGSGGHRSPPFSLVSNGLLHEFFEVIVFHRNRPKKHDPKESRRQFTTVLVH